MAYGHRFFRLELDLDILYDVATTREVRLVGAPGHHDRCIANHADEAALPFQNSYHPVAKRAQPDVAPDGRFVFEELCRDGVADDRDPDGPDVVDSGKAPAVHDVPALETEILVGHADQADILAPLLAAPDLRHVPVGAVGQVPDAGDPFSQDLGVGYGYVRVARLASPGRRVRSAATPRPDSVDGYRVDAEDRSGEVVLHIPVHPFDHGEHRDQEGHSNDHAQEREKGL
jgi:hypothetical protein